MIELNDKEYAALTGYIQLKFGIHLGMQKKNMVRGRLLKVFLRHGFRGFADFYRYLLDDSSGEADKELANAITTNHTFFMREPTHFEFLGSEVLPFLYRKVKDRDLRLWCAACSTGEEAYTLAMVLSDFFSMKKELWDRRILATDICQEVIEYAKKGIYEDEAFATLPVRWQKIYFDTYDPMHHQVKSAMRREVIFRNFNLMQERYPFKRKLHIIFCRNVMIYFDEATIAKLTTRFYDALEPGGYLFIGHSEVLDRSNRGFQYIMPAIYRKE